MTTTTIAHGATPDARRRIANWLFACCALVFAMVVLGGVTRLTRSGLSIVEWQPISGILPPLSQEAWLDLFEKYRHSPEYQKVNAGMSLDDFKGIFWLEYYHRLLGRIIGLAFFVPFAWFLVKRAVSPRLGLRLAGIFVLGGLQGVMGWYMVDSGLIHDPRVSPFRLTAHLLLAFGIYAAMLWTALDLIAPQQRYAGAPAARALRRAMTVTSWLVVLMLVTGGIVAGTRSGLAYNTFPLMNGHVIPPELFMLDPWYRNFAHNPATIQFDHRLFAWALAFVVPWTWWRALQGSLDPRTRFLFHLLLASLVAQIVLGITTLLHAVPVVLGAAHQGGALVVFTVVLLLNHALRAAPAAPLGSVRLDPA